MTYYYVVLISILLGLGVINRTENLSETELDRLETNNQQEVNQHREIHNDWVYE